MTSDSGNVRSIVSTATSGPAPGSSSGTCVSPNDRAASALPPQATTLRPSSPPSASATRRASATPLISSVALSTPIRRDAPPMRTADTQSSTGFFTSQLNQIRKVRPWGQVEAETTHTSPPHQPHQFLLRRSEALINSAENLGSTRPPNSHIQNHANHLLSAHQVHGGNQPELPSISTFAHQHSR